MGELVNPYANPYLPAFVNQRPIINNPSPQMNFTGMNYNQIHSVSGFEEADAYNLANGASEILAEKDPNMARIYVVAKDTNGQMFVQGFDLTPVERPKKATMDDINSTMNQILERLNKLEGEKANEQPNYEPSWDGAKQSGYATNQSNGRNGKGNGESSSNNRTNGSK